MINHSFLRLEIGYTHQSSSQSGRVHKTNLRLRLKVHDGLWTYVGVAPSLEESMSLMGSQHSWDLWRRTQIRRQIGD